MHGAITEVGILYATARCTTGWDNVGRTASFDSTRRTIKGGHAFAIVAYDSEGFWIQNSWGNELGQGRLRPDHLRRLARATAPTSGSRGSARRLNCATRAVGRARRRRAARARAVHRSATCGRTSSASATTAGCGRRRPTAPADDVQEIFTRRSRRDQAEGPDSASPALRARRAGGRGVARCSGSPISRGRCSTHDVYPLSFIWKTDFWTTLKNILEDALDSGGPKVSSTAPRTSCSTGSTTRSSRWRA